MKKEDGALTLLDVLNIASFLIGIQNLELNVSQSDMDKQTQDIDAAAGALVRTALEDIHAHLQKQDAKIDKILEMLNEDHQEDIGHDR